MYFNGNTNSRKINLGGKSRKPKDKKALLEQQSREREKRRQEKLRLDSAIKIQNWIRLVQEKISLKKQFREQFDSILLNENQIIFQNLPSVVRLINFFFDVSIQQDRERAISLSKLILQSINSSDEHINYLYYLFTHTHQYTNQISKFLLICLRCLKFSKEESYFQCLATLTNPSQLLNIAHINFAQHDSFIIHKSCLDIIQYLTKFNFFEKLREIYFEMEGKNNFELIWNVLLSLLNLDSTLLTSEMCNGFVVEFLSIKDFPQKLSLKYKEEFIKFLPVLFQSRPDNKALSFSKLIKDLIPEERMNLVENILDLTPLITVNLTNIDVTPFIKILHEVIDSLPNKVPKIEIDDDDDDYQEWDSIESIDIDSKILNIEEIDQYQQINPSLKEKLLNNLIGTHVLRKLFEKYLDLKNTNLDFNAPFNVLFSEGLQSMIFLCQTIIQNEQLATLKLSLLNSFAFSKNLIKGLWNLLEKTTEFQENYIKFNSSNSIPEINLTLSLFSECYNHSLLTMDDFEFFDEGLFPLDNVINMITILKVIVFRSFWNLDTSSKGLQKSLTSLLKQLYDRDSRHNFCPKNHWIVSEFREGFDFRTERVSIILLEIPFVIPFNERVRLFQSVLEEERGYDGLFQRGKKVKIRRNFIFEDGYSQLNGYGSNLKEKFRISYINSEGLNEAGVDGGGLFKDFLTEIIQTAFSADYALFKTTEEGLLYPNPASHLITEDDLDQFEFLGRIVGKAIFESILVELPLSEFFLAKLLGKFNYINDLVFLDPELHKNLVSLKKLNADEINALDLTFSVDVIEFGATKQIPLIKNGCDIVVTKENVIKYIYLVANYFLNTQIKRQSQAFLRGLSDLISPTLLKAFNQHELQFLISGSNQGIDVANLRQNVVYSGGYSNSHPVVDIFWEVVQNMTSEEQHCLLKFVTSCSRAPLLGFKYLNPPFTIHQADASHLDYLPTASTCMNFLKLPAYSDEQTMKEKLLYAVSANAGFELS